MARDDGLIEKVPAAPRWRAMKETGRGWLYKFFYGAQPEPVPSSLGLVEPSTDGSIGVCCSGGGIRSAAFNLGALQWLDEKRELEKASYLAAVSGGSYIAAAFSMIAKTWPSGERPGPGDSEHDDSDPAALEVMKPFAKGSPEEQYLRNRCSYMAPDGASITFVVFRALLGLAFNIVFLSLPIFAAAMLLGKYAYARHLTGLTGSCGAGCHDHIGWWVWVPAGLFAAGATAALYGMLRRTRNRQGRWLALWSVRLLFLSALMAFLMLATPALVELLRQHGATHTSNGTPHKSGIVGAGAGFGGLILGVLGQLRQGFSTPKKAYGELQKGQKWLRSLSSRSRLGVAYVAGGLLGPALLAAVYVFGVSAALVNSPTTGGHGHIVLIGLCSAAAFAVLYLIADLTSWSLHPFYKRRLCTAFALKRVRTDILTSDERGRVETLPGDGSTAGIAMERDYDELVRLSETAVEDRPWPTLLVCAAANISDAGATPPGRKVTSFTFSPYAVGGPLVGAVETKRLEGAFDGPEKIKTLTKWVRATRRFLPFLREEPRRRVSDFSLPAAVATSGAAISPSMGKLTRRPFTFLLALANIRLGVWVPNPRWVASMGDEPNVTAFGRPRPSYLFKELFGRNRIGDRYLYVTDGGHYENLGLVELLRRGCREIYCFDASGGEGFGSLGDAVALARSELGVDIEIDPRSLFPDKDTDEAKKSAICVEFRYPADPTGELPCKLIYARNVLTPASPWDVRAYHQAEPSFPHNSTADQLYTDQKFEGYRVLGERAGAAAYALMRE
jgi:hypothetical protein